MKKNQVIIYTWCNISMANLVFKFALSKQRFNFDFKMLFFILSNTWQIYKGKGRQCNNDKGKECTGSTLITKKLRTARAYNEVRLKVYLQI